MILSLRLVNNKNENSCFEIRDLRLFVMRLHRRQASISLAFVRFCVKNAISESDISAVNFIVPWRVAVCPSYKWLYFVSGSAPQTANTECMELNEILANEFLSLLLVSRWENLWTFTPNGNKNRVCSAVRGWFVGSLPKIFYVELILPF